jgi:hypothetical protein
MNFVLWGEDKSCKNTLALSFPKPLVDMQFDIGGFERSCRNLEHLPIKTWYEQGLIRVEDFIVPFQITQADISAVRQSKLVVGMKELFYEFAGKFIKHLQDPEIASIMVDTGTLLYDITCQGYLQELQEKQLPLRADGKGSDGKPLMVALYPPSIYRECHIRMRGFAYQAKAHKKHLIVTHHASDEYGMVKQRDGTTIEGRTGARKMHGWGQWGDSADVLGNTSWDSKTGKPYFKAELAEVKELEGLVFEQPTYDKIHAIIELIKEVVTDQEKQLIKDQVSAGQTIENIRAILQMMKGA